MNPRCLFATFAIFVTLRALADSVSPSLVGTYLFQGVRCQSPSDLGLAGLSLNEDIRFANTQTILEITPEHYTSRTRRFAFDRYGADYCLVTTPRYFQKTGDQLNFAASTREFKAVGKFGDLACRKYEPTDKA